MQCHVFVEQQELSFTANGRKELGITWEGYIDVYSLCVTQFDS